ncbi:MAG: cysteine-rich VLP protein [Clostridiales bacterium]|jgi:predicted nucleic acid-binding Zn ribbon protein|nr:cysteine-rich VLP protein [Clostridiales bacterium]
MNQDNTPREFTLEEFRAIKTLVTESCANYDKKYNECVVLDGRCYILNNCYTGSYCKYFKRAVLPLEPTLENQLDNRSDQPFESSMDNIPYKHCDACGLPFTPIIDKEKYCSVRCKKAGEMIKSRELKRKKRMARQKKYA